MAGAFHQISPIMDHLYLCGYPALNPERIQHLGITNIINCSMDIPCPVIGRISYTRVPVHDMPRSNLAPYFEKCADYINNVKSKGGKALVHCMAGVSRSASICIVYLMKYYKMSLAQAYNYVRSKRHVIRPNQGFFKQMIDYENKLFGKTSVKMMNSPIGVIPDVYQKDIGGMIWLTQQDGNPTPKPKASPQLHRHTLSITSSAPNSTSQGHSNAKAIMSSSVTPVTRSTLPPVVTPSFSSKAVFTARQPGVSSASATFTYSSKTPTAANGLSSSADSYQKPGYKYVPRGNSMYRSEPVMNAKHQPMTTYQLSYGAAQKLY